MAIGSAIHGKKMQRKRHRSFQYFFAHIKSRSASSILKVTVRKTLFPSANVNFFLMATFISFSVFPTVYSIIRSFYPKLGTIKRHQNRFFSDDEHFCPLPKLGYTSEKSS